MKDPVVAFDALGHATRPSVWRHSDSGAGGLAQPWHHGCDDDKRDQRGRGARKEAKHPRSVPDGRGACGP